MPNPKHPIDMIIDLIMLPFRIAFWTAFIVIRTVVTGLNH